MIVVSLNVFYKINLIKNFTQGLANYFLSPGALLPPPHQNRFPFVLSTLFARVYIAVDCCFYSVLLSVLSPSV